MAVLGPVATTGANDAFDGVSGAERMAAAEETPRKLSRQQLRALEREKRNATGWISALGTDDPWLRQAIRAALGTRSVTRAELEEALGMSLAETDQGRERS